MQLDYTQLFIKFALGILTLIIQINVFGKSNLAPTTALDQLQNYVLGGIIGGKQLRKGGSFDAKGKIGDVRQQFATDLRPKSSVLSLGIDEGAI